LSSCNRDGGPGALEEELYRNLKQVFGVHPRLLITEEQGKKLARVLETTHNWLWERYLEDLPGKLAQAHQLPDDLGRGHGELAADLAFAWRMTGKDSLFQQAKKYLLGLCRKEVWDPEYDLLHGHLLLGVSLAYDWLYPRLNRAQRTLVANRLGDEAEMQYQRISTQRAWYRNQYLQNHAHVNYGGLAFAAAALYGEDARALDWLAACEDFFSKVFEVSPTDGPSIEGLSYGNYALEFCLRYAELARTVLKRDYYRSKWLANYPDFILHSLLPRPTEDEWAMTFGDSPRHGNYHGPEPQLFLLASKYRNTKAQWLGKKLLSLRPNGLNSASWWALLWYDPQVGEASPEAFPTLQEFSDLGQVMLRSSWQDTSATLIGIKCGPFMAKTGSIFASYDLGVSHGHPDAGSFQIYSHGKFLAIDPGYTLFKQTANHNTLLVKGMGQLGEQEPWFAAAEAISFRHNPSIILSRSTPDHDYVIGDVAPAYHPALGLHKFLRHYLFIKPDVFVVADEITLDNYGMVYSYTADSLELLGSLRYEKGYVKGVRGQASFTFAHPADDYFLAVSYLDNSPGSGSYALIVDGDTVHTWRDTVEITDTHLEIIPGVKLNPGNRVSFSADPMGKDASLIKMMAYSTKVKADPDVSWLLHFDSQAVLRRVLTRIEADLGEICLDVYPLAPPRRNHHWGIYEVKKGKRTRETMCLEIKPVFSDSSTTMLTLMHIRPKDTPPLQWMRSDLKDGIVHIRWYKGNKQFELNLDLANREVTFRNLGFNSSRINRD